MDIGTAKPDKEEMSGVRLYMINEVEPDENCITVRERALECIATITEEGGRPIVTGGRVCINSLVYNIGF